MKIDLSGKTALVTGSTSSPDLPVLNAFQSTFAGDSDAFVLKLDPNGDITALCPSLTHSGSCQRAPECTHA